MKIEFSYVEAARKELQEKSIKDIQIDTAKKWAARAYVAFEIAAYFSSEDRDSAIGWFHVGEEYRHEALKHAALVEGKESDDLLKGIKDLLSFIRDMAIEAVYGVSLEIVTEVEEETVTEEDLEEISEEDRFDDGQGQTDKAD
jgi:hypothetical protein